MFSPLALIAASLRFLKECRMDSWVGPQQKTKKWVQVNYVSNAATITLVRVRIDMLI